MNASVCITSLPEEMKIVGGKVVSLDDVELMKKFIGRKVSKKYVETIKRLPFSHASESGNTLTGRQGYFYFGEPPHESLDAICYLIEEVFETRVNGLKCEYFKDGTHHVPKGRFGDDGKHVFILSMGEARVIDLWSCGGKKIRKVLANRSLLYYRALGSSPPSVIEETQGSIHSYCIPKEKDTTKGTYCVILFTDAPYCRRTEKKVTISFPNNEHIEMMFDFGRDDLLRGIDTGGQYQMFMETFGQAAT